MSLPSTWERGQGGAPADVDHDDAQAALDHVQRHPGVEDPGVERGEPVDVGAEHGGVVDSGE